MNKIRRATGSDNFLTMPPCNAHNSFGGGQEFGMTCLPRETKAGSEIIRPYEDVHVRDGGKLLDASKSLRCLDLSKKTQLCVHLLLLGSHAVHDAVFQSA